MWEGLLERIMDEPDYAWLTSDASHVKIHPHASGARGGNQAMGRTRGCNTKLQMAVDVHGLPRRAVVVEGATADCSQAGVLIEGLRHRRNPGILPQAGHCHAVCEACCIVPLRHPHPMSHPLSPQLLTIVLRTRHCLRTRFASDGIMKKSGLEVMKDSDLAL